MTSSPLKEDTPPQRTIDHPSAAKELQDLFWMPRQSRDMMSPSRTAILPAPLKFEYGKSPSMKGCISWSPKQSVDISPSKTTARLPPVKKEWAGPQGLMIPSQLSTPSNNNNAGMSPDHRALTREYGGLGDVTPTKSDPRSALEKGKQSLFETPTRRIRRPSINPNSPAEDVVLYLYDLYDLDRMMRESIRSNISIQDRIQSQQIGSGLKVAAATPSRTGHYTRLLKQITSLEPLSPSIEQTNTSEGKYDSDATADDPEHNPDYEPKDTMGVEGSGRKKGINLQKPKKSKNPAVYRGPPDFLLNPNRTDRFADPSKVFMRNDGTIHSLVGPITPPAKTNESAESYEFAVPPTVTSSQYHSRVETTNKKQSTPKKEIGGDIKDIIVVAVTAITPTTSNSPEYSAGFEEEVPMRREVKTVVAASTTNSLNFNPDFEEDIQMRPDDKSADTAIITTAFNDEYALLPKGSPPTASKESYVRESSRKRQLSRTPSFEDYPIPIIDDMSIPPHENKYFRAKSGRPTRETPTEYENWREDHLRRRAERKKKDDDEMYKGLLQFKGNQRGWNGQHEKQRRAARENQCNNMNVSEAAGKDQPPPKKSRVTAKMVEDGFKDLQSGYTIGRIGLEDHIREQEERNYREMMSRKWDHYEIRREAIEDGRRAIARLESAESLPGDKQGKSSSSGENLVDLDSPSLDTTRSHKRRPLPPKTTKKAKQTSSEEERLRTSDLGRAFDPPTTSRREVKRPQHLYDESVDNAVMDTVK